MVLTEASLNSALGELLGQHLGDVDARVVELKRLSGGASRETWSFDVIRNSGEVVPCILRRDPPGGRRHHGPDMAAEAELMRAAESAGVPVPHILVSGDGAGTVGTPFIVMERLDGEAIPRRILREAEYEPARTRLVAQCAAAAARIHAIAPDSVHGLWPQDPLAEYRAVLDAHGEPHPAFELVLRWLEQHRPRTGRTCVVHGDFRLGNFLVDPDGLRAVLDWELAHIGDPVEDLGWLCVRSWRFGSNKVVAGVGDVDELLDAYAAAGGEGVEPERLRWWEMMGTLRWGVICIVQAATHTSGAVRSVELAAIGRRVCEVEWDLLRLLDDVRG